MKLTIDHKSYVPLHLQAEELLRHLIADLTRQTRGMQAGVETLEELLDLGRVVPPQDIPRNVVTMNSKIVFEELQTREKRSVTVVYPEDADPVAGAQHPAQLAVDARPCRRSGSRTAAAPRPRGAHRHPRSQLPA